jgi:hypothetical protein
MKNKINFKIFFKKLKHSLKNIGSDADKDWAIMITFFFFVFICIVIFHINLFLNIQSKLGEIGINAEAPNKAINSELLGEMVSRYEKRAGEYKRIEDTNFQMIDPS